MSAPIYTYAADCVHCVAEKAIAQAAKPPEHVKPFDSAWSYGVCEGALKFIAEWRSFKACARHRQPRVRRPADA